MSDRGKPRVSVVVPVYNSEPTLPTLVAALSATMPAISSEWEAIFVDDGSRDGSWRVLEELTDAAKDIAAIRLSRNYGQHNALLCGIRAARHEVIVTIDDDLQHPPEEIGKLLEKLGDGYDVVYGTPARQEHGLWRDLASTITKLGLRWSMRVAVAKDVSAFRAIRTEVIDAFRDFAGPYVSIDVLLTWGTTRFTSVAVDHHPRREGRSNYTFGKLLVHAINMATGFSTWPLRLASVVGFGSTLFGIAVLVYVLGRLVITGGSIPGFPFLASALAIFSGAQLFALGIMGEYLARMYGRTMDRPTYVVRRRLGLDDEKA